MCGEIAVLSPILKCSLHTFPSQGTSFNNLYSSTTQQTQTDRIQLTNATIIYYSKFAKDHIFFLIVGGYDVYKESLADLII